MTMEAVAKLPENKPYDYAVYIKDGETPPSRLCYALSENELEVVRDCLTDMLDIGKSDVLHSLPDHKYYLYQRHMVGE
jgi:hypothetical protein